MKNKKSELPCLDHKYCYCYTVCWRSDKSKGYPTRWFSNIYPLKKEAKRMAKDLYKKYKGVKPKPYIIRTIVTREYFRFNIEVEEAPFIDVIKYEHQEKYIGY